MKFDKLNFNQVKGQPQAVELLTRAIALNKIAPAYLFSGPEGVGRHLAALGFAQLLLSQNITSDKKSLIAKQVLDYNHPDLLWVEPTYLHQGQLITAAEAAAASLSRKTSPQIRIEQIRQITEFLGRPPLSSIRSLVVIEGANQMTEAAANALLKTLEEPGLGTIILIADGNRSLLPTLVSRCQKIPFYRLSDSDLITVLTDLGQSQITTQTEVLSLAQGSPGKAIAHSNYLQEMDQELLNKLKQPPHNLIEVFSFAQQITEDLDTELQLWLIDYLQVYYWQINQSPTITKIWEQARQFIYQYVNPRLVWECTFLEIYNSD